MIPFVMIRKKFKIKNNQAGNLDIKVLEYDLCEYKTRQLINATIISLCCSNGVSLLMLHSFPIFQPILTYFPVR